MGDIIESRRRHYVGLDADKNTIPAAGKAFGDSYHANDKGKQYYWNGAAWKTGLGYEYVPIAKGAWDWLVGDFTIDGAFHVDGLDCGAKGVPAGAVAVHFQGILLDNAAGTNFVIRKNAVDIINVLDLLTQVANINLALNAIIMIDSNLLMDYYGTAGLDTISLAVVGYFI